MITEIMEIAVEYQSEYESQFKMTGEIIYVSGLITI